jgi:hypothetical protein
VREHFFLNDLKSFYPFVVIIQFIRPTLNEIENNKLSLAHLLSRPLDIKWVNKWGH